ncbi:serine/threonine-protein kinase PknK [Luteitalea sp. TBR-22]|uniref:serine/threonine-protein kinase n=1 Tax=Luteitalea sp. TBR-22 TaxID=2802971 RepID=UPI001EF6193D|nr:serine/threonine-protein kinase [Luteitalea sp. TBR-22]
MSSTPDGGKPAEPSRVGQYRIEQRLGAGGMGAVYRAFDESLQRPVAIKRLLPTMADQSRSLRFRREARMAARLNHPAIVHIYEIVETADGDWIVMELVEGKTLDRLLREGRMDIGRAVRVAREIAEGLSEAHAQGIVHRDLKATNVMVTAAGRVKILDFGLAKAWQGDVDQEISTPGTVVGTCHAMSPEQAQGLTVDHRSDLFSLGSLLYELLTGMSPFHAATPTETLARICAYEPDPVASLEPAIPPALAELTHRLLSKSAAQRPQGSWEVAAALERIERAGGLDKGARRAVAPAATEVFTQVEGATPPPSARPSPPPLTSTERRQMTVLCCELADAASPGTEPGEAFDPESLYELMMQLRPLALQAVQRYDGTLGTAMGHRLLVYFGYPQAHEDDAWRAVRTGLDLVGEVEAQLAAVPGLGRVVPALRVGIHTGTAVVTTSPGAPEPVVLGATLDVALRLLASAAPGAVVVSGATRSLVHRGVVAEPLPSLAHGSGSGVGIAAWRMRDGQDGGDDAVFDLSPIVGRERELALLEARWQDARAGHGHAVLITGEPGIGKSRLLRATRERLDAAQGNAPLRWMATHGTPYTQNTPMHAVVQWLQRLLATAPGPTPAARLVGLLDDHGLGEAVPLVAGLLGIAVPPDRPLRAMPPERQREETLDALVALVLEMAQREPLVLLIEDLHWLDATTLAWLDRLIDQAQSAPLLLVMTLRPNTLEVPWAARAQVTQVTLGALAQEEVERLIRALVGDGALLPQVQAQIVARTDGVPLFVEELTRSVMEGGTSSHDSAEWRELPATLRESLTTRLARLGPAKEVAQLASVIGRAFTLPLLSAVSAHPPDQLERELRQLVQSGLVHRRGFGVAARYAFKHALVRDAAYDSLLRRERQQIHLRIAAALEELQRTNGEEASHELLAHHYMSAERFAPAFEHWLAAGQSAMGRYAHAEAIGHLRQALTALAALPPTAERDRKEIGARGALVLSLGMVHGLGSPEVEATQERLLALVTQVGDVPHELAFGLWNFYASRGKLRRARELAQQRLEYGVAHGDGDARLLGLYTSAAADLFLGHFAQARDNFETLLSLYPPDGLATRAIAYDIGAVARSLLADVRWLLGEPARAIQAAEDALLEARQRSPFTESVALVNRMAMALSMEDAAGSATATEALIALSTEHGYQYWTVFWQISRAVQALRGPEPPADVDAAIEQGATAIAIMRNAYASSLQCSRYLAWMADASLRQGRVERARAFLSEAFAVTEDEGERYWEAELHRLDGRVRAAEGRDTAACVEACQRAIEVARAQRARTFELRAAIDLARLLGADGRSAEAAALLRPLVDAWGEAGGADVVAAQALV